jgi:hypothetical protein
VHLELANRALTITKNLEEAETQVELARRTLPNNSQVEVIAGRSSPARSLGRGFTML